MTSFVLIDLENVQPKNLSRLNRGAYNIKVFHGAKQAKVSLEMARALQAFGADAEYVQIDGEGKNALDFHIAYYIGRLAAKTPGGTFHVISADTGFDPLIRHLAAQKISCQRWKSITVKMLRSAIDALFQKQLAAQELDALVDRLTQKGTIRVADGKVQYALPA